MKAMQNFAFAVNGLRGREICRGRKRKREKKKKEKEKGPSYRWDSCQNLKRRLSISVEEKLAIYLKQSHEAGQWTHKRQ